MSNSGFENPVDRILSDVGRSFTIGFIVGSCAEFKEGFSNSPKGHRFISAVRNVYTNTPRTAVFASAIAFWPGGVVSGLEMGTRYMRQKEDKWNLITSGSVAGFLYEYTRCHRLVPAAKFGILCSAGAVLVVNTVDTAMSFLLKSLQ